MGDENDLDADRSGRSPNSHLFVLSRKDRREMVLAAIEP